MSTTDIYRTPESCFEGLTDFDFAPHYFDDLEGFDGLRLHYLDEGPRDADHVYLCLHGEPTWSYLYRKMLPVFIADGGRVIAPDLFGFGRSDKPLDEVYSFDFHRASLLRLLERLDLNNITIVCQDWGGLLGLTLPLAVPDQITRLIAMNTILCTGEMPLPPAFSDWKQWAAEHPDMDIAAAVAFIDDTLSPEQCAAYRAPFPNERSKAGVRAFPRIVPIEMDSPGADISRRARDWWRTDWTGQAVVFCGVHDQILGLEVTRQLSAWIKNCPPPIEVAEAGHYVQEWGAAVARRALSEFSA